MRENKFIFRTVFKVEGFLAYLNPPVDCFNTVPAIARTNDSNCYVKIQF